LAESHAIPDRDNVTMKLKGIMHPNCPMPAEMRRDKRVDSKGGERQDKALNANVHFDRCSEG